MASFEADIMEAEAKLRSVQEELDMIDVMKAQEKQLRQDEASLIAKIADLEEAMQADKSEQHFFGSAQEEEQLSPDAKSKPKKEVEPPKGPTAPVQRDAESEKKAKMKALNKKLQQIEKLKQKPAAELDADGKKKLSAEPKLRKKLDAIARGEEYEDSDAEQEPSVEAAPTPASTLPFTPPAVKEEPPEASEHGDDEAISMQLPTDPAEVEKRTRTLKKKLQQIAKLKGKGELDAEAASKVATEYRLVQELEALEQGKDEVIFEEPAKQTDEDIKFDLEKKMKAVRKKLDQIKTLKEKDGDLDADAKAKVESEAALVKEENALAQKIAVFAKAERARVAERMGWEDEAKQNEAETKNAKKSRAKAASKS